LVKASLPAFKLLRKNGYCRKKGVIVARSDPNLTKEKGAWERVLRVKGRGNAFFSGHISRGKKKISVRIVYRDEARKTRLPIQRLLGRGEEGPRKGGLF